MVRHGGGPCPGGALYRPCRIITNCRDHNDGTPLIGEAKRSYNGRNKFCNGNNAWYQVEIRLCKWLVRLHNWVQVTVNNGGRQSYRQPPTRPASRRSETKKQPYSGLDVPNCDSGGTFTGCNSLVLVVSNPKNGPNTRVGQPPPIRARESGHLRKLS